MPFVLAHTLLAIFVITTTFNSLAAEDPPAKPPKPNPAPAPSKPSKPLKPSKPAPAPKPPAAPKADVKDEDSKPSAPSNEDDDNEPDEDEKPNKPVPLPPDYTGRLADDAPAPNAAAAEVELRPRSATAGSQLDVDSSDDSPVVDETLTGGGAGALASARWLPRSLLGAATLLAMS